ncbi:MAG: anti-sigma F factor [Clostridia bacterium]|nr:anti-sigma F factor [Clostridia bacterium]
MLTIDAKLINEGFIRSMIAAFCVPLNPSISEINDIKTAVSEAVTNCIVHGYAGASGDIDVLVGIRKNVVFIKISDHGIGIENIERARQPFFTTKSKEERSGMGFTLMESFMDTINVYNNKTGGVTVELSKEIKN